MEVARLSNINKTYATGELNFHALKNVSLSIADGDFLAIMGPSGSGKTTLLDILGCISRPTSGEYLLDGTRVDALDNDTLAHVRNRKIGFIFQNFQLIPNFNVVENVELPLIYAKVEKEERLDMAMSALRNVGLADKSKNRPNQLSGGQRQRVAIARAIINKPSIILADEPTGSLDSKTGAEILNIFQELNRNGSTIIMITHDADIATHASRKIYMKDGEITSP